MTNKLTAASGTNQYNIFNNTLNSEYNTKMLYNGMIEFSKALRCYYSESTAHDRAQVYQPWLAGNSLKTRPDVNKHTLELLVNTLKEEVNINIVLKDRIAVMENKMLSNEKKHAVLDNAEKNRKDPHHREQLLKYCLLMLAGFALFGLINYL